MSLSDYIKAQALDPIGAMNRLMEAGVVSDNAEWPTDVAEADWARAIEFLQRDRVPLQEELF